MNLFSRKNEKLQEVTLISQINMQTSTANDQQDVILTDIGASLVRIKIQAGEMNSELDNQHVMLKEFSEEVEDNQMQIVRHERKMQNLLNSSGCHKLICVLVLFAVVVGLVMIIVYG